MAKANKLQPLIDADRRGWKKEKDRLPKLIGEEARNFYEENFRRQGFLDSTVKPWKPRKGEKKRSKRTKKTDKEARGILIGSGSGKLSKSLKVTKANKRRVVIKSVMATSFNYSGVHNYGLRAGRGSGFIMPKRQFLGDSKTLNKKLIKFIKKKINKGFK